MRERVNSYNFIKSASCHTVSIAVYSVHITFLPVSCNKLFLATCTLHHYVIQREPFWNPCNDVETGGERVVEDYWCMSVHILVTYMASQLSNNYVNPGSRSKN